MARRESAPKSRRRSASRRRGGGARWPFSRDLASAAAMTAAIVALVARRAGADGAAAGLLSRRARRRARGAARRARRWRPGSGVLARGAGGAAGGGVRGRAGRGPAADARAARRWGRCGPISARLSPAAGLERAFGGQAALQVGKGLLKVDAGGGHRLGDGAAGAGRGDGAGRRGAGRACWRRCWARWRRGSPSGWRWWRWRSACADYLLVRRRHRRGLRMTREEVKREAKESEGDPSHRAERQRLHRELLEQRMVAEVRKADFVVVNPDHIAVALRYDRDGDGRARRGRARRAAAGRADQAGGARGGRADLSRRDAGALAARPARRRGDPGRALRGGGRGAAGRSTRWTERPAPRSCRGRPSGGRTPARRPAAGRRCRVAPAGSAA